MQTVEISKSGFLKAKLKAVQGRLRNRPDSEHKQAMVRIFLTIAVVIIFLAIDHAIVFFLTIAYLAVAISILVWILVSPMVNPIRRLVGIFGDVGMTSAVLYLADEAGILALFVYLWVIIGNGFRYGPKYLNITTIASLLGASLVLISGSYWSQHFWIGFTLLLCLAILPVYMSSLLKQLHLAIEKAEQASKAKSQFLAHMSHELRTPLNGIIGVTTLLHMTSLSKKQQKYADLIALSGKTLLALIENVLDISKIEAGKLTTEAKPFDLHQLVTTTIQVFKNQADKKGLSLSAHVAPEVPFRLIGDELHIRQVLLNFLSNALKFTAEGRVELTVEISSIQTDNTVTLLFSIIDTGIGLSTEAQHKIFDSFVQADASVTREYGGTGLGTTIAKELITALGGKLGLDSELGKGSTFWFELPFKLQEKLSKETIAKSSFQNARILTMLRPEHTDSIKIPLQRWGQQQQNTENVIGLLSSLLEAHQQNHPFDLAILEEDLLGMPASQFIKNICNEERYESIGFILITRNASKEHEHELLHLGFSSVLTQPINESLLFNAIHEICHGNLYTDGVTAVSTLHQKQDKLKSLLIMVAEDNEVNQVVIREFLELMGHKVVLVDNGEQALDTLTDNDEDFDIAFLDINMPHLSGLEVLKAYRFLKPETRLPIVMLSADALSTNIQECLDAGADAYLTKPIEKQKIEQTIDRLTHHITHSSQNDTLQHVNSDEQPTMKSGTTDTMVLDKLAAISKKEKFVENLITKFITTSQERSNQLVKAYKDNNPVEYALICHALEGSSGAVGAAAVNEICAHLQGMTELTPEIMSKGIQDIQSALAQSEKEFSAYIHKRLDL